MTQANEQAQPRPLLKPLEARALYRLPRNRLYSAIHSGELKTKNLGTAKKAAFYIDPVDIEAWLDSLTFEAQK